jgi:hypothetical protein
MGFSKILPIAASLALAAALTGCVHTQEMPLAPNVVRINTQASGLLYAGKAVPSTMTAAARATLSRGYTHFKIGEAGLDQGSEINGLSTYGGRHFASTTVDRVNVEKSEATITMFHEGEPGAKGAFVAEEVLAQYKDQTG